MQCNAVGPKYSCVLVTDGVVLNLLTARRACLVQSFEDARLTLPDCPAVVSSVPASQPSSTTSIIVGATVGAVALVVALALLVLWRLRRRRLTAEVPSKVAGKVDGLPTADLPTSDVEAGPPLAPLSPLFSRLTAQSATLSPPDASRSSLTPSYITTAGPGTASGSDPLPPGHPSTRHSPTCCDAAACTWVAPGLHLKCLDPC